MCAGVPDEGQAGGAAVPHTQDPRRGETRQVREI